MKLMLYNPAKHEHFLKDYLLSDISHTDSPQNIIDKYRLDHNRYPVAILNNEENKIIGFFCFHSGSGPQEYGFYQNDYALIRGFSIDDRYRNQGYSSKALKDIFQFIDLTLNLKTNHIILAVNEKNLQAQKAYKNSGFSIIKRNVKGKKGNLLIMEKVRI